MNGQVTVLLAKAAKSQVPEPRIRFFPETVECIERFDRNGSVADRDNALLPTLPEYSVFLSSTHASCST